MTGPIPPASDEPFSDPFAEFIDDYFVECDEHLAVARRSLLALEPGLAIGRLDTEVMDDLFRSCHSIKGLSAMVGVREAELLAHDMESYLGALRKGAVRLTADGLNLLIVAVNVLEQIIMAKRRQSPPPDILDLLSRFAGLTSNPAAKQGLATGAMATGAMATGAIATSGMATGAMAAAEGHLSPEKHELVETAVAKGQQPFWFRFVPSAALAERGVNVNSVRQRLQEHGRLVEAAPMLAENGQIAFAFLVICESVKPEFAAWVADGLTYVPYDSKVPTAAAETAANGQSPASGSGAPASGALRGGALGNGPSTAITNVVRVELSRLDALMRMVGELVISRARLNASLQRTENVLPPAEWRSLQETNQALERQLRDLREGIMHVRMVPVRDVFARMQFVVRDLTRELQKKVALTLHGEETEIDKFIVERIMDPLLHLVRNAVSHGLEPEAERVAQGKPAEGQLELRANATGETIRIEVADDGRGIDAEQVLSKARQAGLPVPDSVSDEALLEILCTPGFSTRDAADLASGRGMGMSVVREVVEELGGLLALETRVGRGTRFMIHLPLTLSIADALIVTAGGQTFAVPQASVREVLEIHEDAIHTLENNELFLYREGAIPYVRLPVFFGLPERNGSLSVLVVGEGRNTVGIGVERVLGLREVVVRPLIDPLVRVPGVGGATELGDGRVVLILDTVTFTRGGRSFRNKPLAGIVPLSKPIPVAGA
jgi:two-component system chemotaxis sensor kinase CheA